MDQPQQIFLDKEEIVAAKKFVIQNSLFTLETQNIICVDEGYPREITISAPIRLAGADVGVLGAIIATAQESNVLLHTPEHLVATYIGAKKIVFPKRDVNFSYHTDGRAHMTVGTNTHSREDMNCGHINGLVNENIANTLYGFMDKGRYLRQVLKVITTSKMTDAFVEKIRLRQDKSDHDAKGALLVYGEGSVHSRSQDNKKSYYVVDMDRANLFFKKIIPYMSLSLDPLTVFKTYKRQAMATLGRVSTDKGNMPVLRIDYSGKNVTVILISRV